MTLLKAIFTAFILLFLHFFLPLAFLDKLYLLLSPQIVVLLIASLFLLLSQPRISISETKKHQDSDKGTTLLILLIASLGLFSSIFEWSLYRNPSTILSGNIFTITGLILIISGLSFRLYSIWSLGQNFAATVQIKEEQQLITSGIYSYLRHPSYTGAWCMLMGYGVFLSSILGSLLLGLGLLFAYQQRIKTEETTLIQAFGQKYLDYQRTTYRMLPRIW